MKSQKQSDSHPELEQLSTLQLPSLPLGTPYLLKSLTNENIDFLELATVIEKFPIIAAKLISLVNSAWSAPAAEITALEATCSRLGFGVVRSTSIALAISAPFDPTKCQSFDPEYFWCSSLLTAEAASRLVDVSSANNQLEPATARVAGLLHNLGLLWLIDRLPVECDMALNMVINNQTDSLQQALLDTLGFDQSQAAGYLGSSWDLPESLVAAISHYLDPDYAGAHREIVATVGLAVSLVSAVLKNKPCPDTITYCSTLGISDQELKQLFDQLNQQLEKTRSIVKVLV